MDSPMNQPLSRDEAGWLDWAYKGVDHSLPGNGGPECRDFLSLSQRCWESAIASLVGLFALMYAYPRLTLPVSCPSRYANGEPMGKRILLLLMCLTFGIELGFKFSTRQVIWIGNPCHVASMLQIFILAAPPSRVVTAAFRMHMHMLTGAPIAILFPVINTRLLPFETGVYYIQHILMLVIPFYLMKVGDPYIPEELFDFKWAFTSFGFLYIYHFLPLQFLAYHSQVNLNNMLCPAVSDPFHGKYYRLFAICHQIILIPTLGKVFVLIARAFNLLPVNRLASAPLKEVFQCDACEACPEPCLSISDSSSRDSGISAFSQHQAAEAEGDESFDDLGGTFNQVAFRSSQDQQGGDFVSYATARLVNGTVTERSSTQRRSASGDDGPMGSIVKSRRSTMEGDDVRSSKITEDKNVVIVDRSSRQSSSDAGTGYRSVASSVRNGQSTNGSRRTGTGRFTETDSRQPSQRGTEIDSRQPSHGGTGKMTMSENDSRHSSRATGKIAVSELNAGQKSLRGSGGLTTSEFDSRQTSKSKDY